MSCACAPGDTQRVPMLHGDGVRPVEGGKERAGLAAEVCWEASPATESWTDGDLNFKLISMFLLPDGCKNGVSSRWKTVATAQA